MMTATDRSPGHPAPLAAQAVRGGADIIDSLASEWSALCALPANDQPFYKPDWFRSYASAFASDAQIVLITVRAEGRLAGVLPLAAQIGTVGGLPARKLRTLGNTHTCRCELVHDPAFGEEKIVETVWDALLREPRWDVVELENAPAGGALTRLVEHAARQGYRTHAAPVLAPPYLDLERCAGRFDALLGRLDAKFRSNVRRRRRKLEALGSVALLSDTVPAPLLDRFYALERAGWKGAAGSAIACDAATRAFYDDAARSAAAKGTLLFYALELDGRAIAIHFGLYDDRRYYLLKTTYDESLRECSPGQLLTHDALRDLIARGARELDFLGGEMEWKADWGPQPRQLYDLHVFRGSTGRALHALRFRLRPAIARAVRRMRGA